MEGALMDTAVNTFMEVNILRSQVVTMKGKTVKLRSQRN